MTGDDLVIDTLDYDLSFVSEQNMGADGLGAATGDAGRVAAQLDPGESQLPGARALSRPTGPDVSDHNSNVNWDKVRAAGHEFAIAKASEGLTWRATTFP